MASLRWGLIADDLTGACDAGVQFAQREFSSVVRLDDRPEEEPGELTILTTDSRGDSPREAGQKVRRACSALVREQIDVAYKKIDSTLEGNIGPEIEAVMETCGFKLAIVAPAFPALGRTLAGGSLEVAGSEAAAKTSVHLPSLLSEQGAKRVAHVDRSVLVEGERALIKRLKSVSASGGGITVVDAASDDDLALIARAAAELQPQPLMAGSAGFAAQIASVLAKKHQRKPASDQPIGAPREDAPPIILFVGSAHPIVREQIDHLVAARRGVITALERNEMGLVRETLRRNRPLVVTIDLKQDSEQRVAEFAGVFEEVAVHALVFSGGDTARMVCRALKTRAIKLAREIVPGVPWGWLVGGRANGTMVVTKAGGFGKPETLTTVADFLASR